jgi:prepilin-type N-terminal cleavage/methylation domain-containing protein
MQKKIIKNNNRGFTLIEVLVSLTLFTIVLVMAGGTVVSVIDINKRNQAISSVVNNLNYSIDSMIRDIKTGYLYKCDYSGTYTVMALKEVSVIPSQSDCINLTLVSTISGVDVVVKYDFVQPVPTSSQNGYILKTVFDVNGSQLGMYNITDKTNVNIESLNLSVKNPDALSCDSSIVTCDYGQPSVAVVIKGMAGSQQIEVSKFYVQTFISQRLINVSDFKNPN